MVDVLIDWKSWETTFGGETVRMELRPLKRYAMALLTPHMKDLPRDETDLKADMFKLAGTAYELQELAAQIFPDHIRNIENLTASGKPVKPDMLAEESVFVGLANQIIGELITRSVITEGDAKNSASPSQSDTEGEADSTPPASKVSPLHSG